MSRYVFEVIKGQKQKCLFRSFFTKGKFQIFEGSLYYDLAVSWNQICYSWFCQLTQPLVFTMLFIDG